MYHIFKKNTLETIFVSKTINVTLYDIKVVRVAIFSDAYITSTSLDVSQIKINVSTKYFWLTLWKLHSISTYYKIMIFLLIKINVHLYLS